jgi:hypothetical protein
MSGFSTQKFVVDSEPVTDTQKTNKSYKKCYVDADTFVVRCAKMMQEDYIEVLHKPSGRLKEFRNKTEFGIRGDKIIGGGWLDTQNQLRQKKGVEPFPIEDFEILSKARLNPDYSNFEEALKQSEMVFASHIKAIKREMDSEDYVLLISSGNGNYRDKESKTIGYKSGRGEKPIYFQEFKDVIANTYKTKIWWTENNEAEDYVQYIAKQQETLYGDDRSKWDSCAAWVDKDVNQVFITHKNYDKYEQGWIEYDKFYCEKTLCAQTISGDNTDTIQGLPTLTESVTKQFGLRKANGVSKATAEKLLDNCKTIQEMWERVLFCYQQYYGFDKQYKFKDIHGDDQNWVWLDYAQQCYTLVKMQEYQGQVPCLRKYLDKIGVDYTKGIKYDGFVVDTEGLADNVLVCQNTIMTLKELIKSYKSLPKPKLVEKFDEVSKIVEELEGNLKLLIG